MGLLRSFERWKRILLALKGNEKRFELLENNMAHLISEEYAALKAELPYRTFLRQKEFKIFSQNGEDGLILFIFSQIGAPNRNFVEFGFGDGRQCNAANLIIHFGWKGLMMDGSRENVQKAVQYYDSLGITEQQGLKIRKCFVTRENINPKLQEFGMRGETDMLSIDIDGNDYWIWEAIHVINPRLVVIEYNASLGSQRSISVPYDPAFDRFKKHGSGWYHGASLLALKKLGDKKGYALVGCNSHGVNAFFVRKDLIKGRLRALSAKEGYYPNRIRSKRFNPSVQWKAIVDMAFVEIN